MILQFLVTFFIVLPALLSALNFLPFPPYWFAEFNHLLSLYYLAHHVSALVILLLFRRSLKSSYPRFLPLLLFLLGAGYFYSLTPFLFKNAPAVADLKLNSVELSSLERCRVMLLDLDSSIDSRVIVDLLNKERPEILGIAGNNFQTSDFKDISARFSYRRELSVSGWNSLALYSQMPFLNEELVSVGEGFPPVIVDTFLSAANDPITVVIFQAPFPNSHQSYHFAKVLVRRFSTRFRHSRNKLIVLAALNAPQSSNSYGRLRQAASAKDAMWGNGLWRTWNMTNFWQRLTFDHVLYRGRMIAEHYRVIQLEQQPHGAVLADFLLAPESNVVDSALTSVALPAVSVAGRPDGRIKVTD